MNSTVWKTKILINETVTAYGYFCFTTNQNSYDTFSRSKCFYNTRSISDNSVCWASCRRFRSLRFARTASSPSLSKVWDRIENTPTVDLTCTYIVGDTNVFQRSAIDVSSPHSPPVSQESAATTVDHHSVAKSVSNSSVSPGPTPPPRTIKLVDSRPPSPEAFANLPHAPDNPTDPHLLHDAYPLPTHSTQSVMISELAFSQPYIRRRDSAKISKSSIISPTTIEGEGVAPSMQEITRSVNATWGYDWRTSREPITDPNLPTTPTEADLPPSQQTIVSIAAPGDVSSHAVDVVPSAISDVAPNVQSLKRRSMVNMRRRSSMKSMPDWVHIVSTEPAIMSDRLPSVDLTVNRSTPNVAAAENQDEPTENDGPSVNGGPSPYEPPLLPAEAFGAYDDVEEAESVSESGHHIEEVSNGVPERRSSEHEVPPSTSSLSTQPPLRAPVAQTNVPKTKAPQVKASNVKKHNVVVTSLQPTSSAPPASSKPTIARQKSMKVIPQSISSSSTSSLSLKPPTTSNPATVRARVPSSTMRNLLVTDKGRRPPDSRAPKQAKGRVASPIAPHMVPLPPASTSELIQSEAVPTARAEGPRRPKHIIKPSDNSGTNNAPLSRPRIPSATSQTKATGAQERRQDNAGAGARAPKPSRQRVASLSAEQMVSSYMENAPESMRHDVVLAMQHRLSGQIELDTEAVTDTLFKAADKVVSRKSTVKTVASTNDEGLSQSHPVTQGVFGGKQGEALIHSIPPAHHSDIASRQDVLEVFAGVPTPPDNSGASTSAKPFPTQALPIIPAG